MRVERVAEGRYLAHNDSGASIPIGVSAFSPVGLLAAIGGCTAVDTDVATSRRTDVVRRHGRGDKVSDEGTG